MKVCVQGLWHLGSVTAACLADYGVSVIGLDEDQATIANLAKAVPPLFEPGLAELVAKGLESGKLAFTTDKAKAVADADIVWVAFDTPVDDNDAADVGLVQARVESIFPHLKSGAVVLVSSQMPVGSIAELERKFAAVAAGRAVSFACSPENLRLGKAIEIFARPGRIVIGTRPDGAREKLEPLLSQICDTLIWVSVESGEMTKHALNAFLATCVTFANEIATVCEEVGADAGEVERAIRSDPRVGNNTYVKPGAAFAGGTLARDVRFLEGLGRQKGVSLPLLDHVVPSNDAHRLWAMRRLKSLLGDLKGRRIAMLGLSYKPGTDAIRRSVAIELCRLLIQAGASIAAYDPKVAGLPDDLKDRVALAASAEEAICGADALVVATEWPQFRELAAERVAALMPAGLVLDQSGFLERTLAKRDGIRYIAVGNRT